MMPLSPSNPTWKSKHPRVTLIIVNWNGEAYIAKCLDAVRKQAYGDFTTIVLDNASADDSTGLISEKYPEVELICLDRNVGFAAANNIAIRRSQSEYVALLNNDAIPEKVWLAELVHALDINPEAGSAASKMLFYDRPELIDRAGDVYTTAGTAVLRGRNNPSHCFDRQEWVFGACAGAALYRRELFDDVGLFDEKFFLLYEDVDFSFRSQLKGYRCLYVPEAVVYHMVSTSIGDDTPLSVYYSHRNLEWVYWQNMPRELIWKTVIPHLVYILGAWFFFGCKGRGGVFFKAKIAALAEFKRVVAARRRMHQDRRVHHRSLLDLMQKERYWPRLQRRIRAPKPKLAP